MRILVTAFEPFGGSDRNPTMEIAGVIGAAMPWVTTRVLPVVTGVGQGSAWSAVQPMLQESWDAVLHLGESGKASTLMVERLAVNLRDGGMADNAGSTLRDRPVVDGGPDAYFSTMPVRDLVEASIAASVPAALSLSAGTFLCNETMYRSLHWSAGRGGGLLVGFIHVPQLPQQAAVRGGPSMDAAESARGVCAALSLLQDAPTLA